MSVDVAKMNEAYLLLQRANQLMLEADPQGQTSAGFDVDNALASLGDDIIRFQVDDEEDA